MKRNIRKKIVCIIVLFLLLVFLTSCKDTISYDSGVDITIPKDLASIIVYQGELPKLHFAYEGQVNVADFSTSCKYLFAKNDFYKFSEAFAEHIGQFENRGINTKVVERTEDDGEARFGNEKLPIDEPNRYSQEIMRVIWDHTGTRYSYFYRTFVSNGKRYYVTPYTTNITITMELPLFVQKSSGQNKIYLLSLPYDTKYDVNGNLELDKLLEKDEYTSDLYYKFDYPEYVSNLSLAEQTSQLKKWYIDNCQGTEENGIFYYTYLGNRFEVIFDLMIDGQRCFEIKLA